MKKSKGIYSLIVLFLLLGLAVVTVAAILNKQHVNTVKNIRPADTLFKKHVYDKQLLQKLEKLCRKYDTLKKAYTIEGTINLIDKADTAVKLRNAGFVYCKKGDDFYYKIGANETINQQGLYVAIDNKNRSIVVSQQKKIEDSNEGKMLDGLVSALRSEAYNLVSTKTGDQETLSLINEHHVSCKQYSVSYDTLALNISRIYTRFTNIYEPLRKDNEKIVDLKIDRWDQTVNLKNYTSGKNVVSQGASGKWKATDKFVGYKVIIM